MNSENPAGEAEEEEAEPMVSGVGRRSNKRKYFTIWTEFVERTMIKFFKNRPFLWHPRAKGYFQKDKKDAALEQLAAYLGDKYTAAMIRDRWCSMRSSFLANDKKVEGSPRDPRTGNPLYVPSWPYYDDLLFLRESRYARSKLSDSYDYEEDPFLESTADLTDIPVEDEHDWIKREILAEEAAAATAPPPCSGGDDCNSSCHYELSSQDPPRNEVAPAHLLHDVLRGSRSKGHDACDSFGTVVAASLRDMDSFRRARAQLDIQRVLLKYNPDNPEGFNSAFKPSASSKH